MTYPPRAIIFDFGNVLVKWNLYAIFGRFFPDPQAVDAFLKQVSFYEWNTRQDGGRSFEEGLAVISEQFPHYAHIFRYFDQHWQDTVREVIPETIVLARRLKQAGYPLYVLSNFSAEKFALTRPLHPFVSIFDDLIISGEIGLLKPEPAIFQYTLSRIHRTAEECIFIDDHLPNVESAQRLGFTALPYRSPQKLERDLTNLGVI